MEKYCDEINNIQITKDDIAISKVLRINLTDDQYETIIRAQVILDAISQKLYDEGGLSTSLEYSFDMVNENLRNILTVIQHGVYVG